MNDVKRYSFKGAAGLYVYEGDYDALAQRCRELEQCMSEPLNRLVRERDELRAEVERLCAERDQLDRIARHLVRAYIIDDQAYDPEKATNARLASYKERFK